MSNLQKINAFFSAYANKDVSAVGDVMAEDIVWRIPGHHPLTGEKKGIKEMLAFFDQLAKLDSRRSLWSLQGRGLCCGPSSRLEHCW